MKKILLLLLCVSLSVNFVMPVRAAESKITETFDEANEKLKILTECKDIFALVYLCDDYSVKELPEIEANDIVTIYSGQQVRIKEVVFSEERIWYLAEITVEDKEYTGYIEKEYLAYSDEQFITWEKENILNYFPNVNFYTDGVKEVEQFPVSYQKYISALKQAHPNWTFVKFDTGLNWNTVVSEEMKESRSLVPSSSPDSWKKGNYGGGWSYASEGALKYYLDPRNFLNESYIFQFEQLTFNKSYHTEAAIQKFLDSTFMAGKIPEDSQTYASAFWKVGNNLGVSPFHLASRVYQEQGAGTSPLISGNYPGYEGLYNYYNIGASGSTDEEEIRSGLQRAREEGWKTRYLSLEGGAKILSANYILKGQDTLYLQKFDVDGSANGLYWHQYMQNICAPANEGMSIRKLYMNTNAVDNTFVFKVPVYNHMPSSPCKIDGSSSQIEYYSPVFNAEYYYNRYGDLRNIYGYDVNKLLKHFINQGMKEGRQGCEEFNVKIYRANYGDLRNAYGDNLERYYKHYIISGQAEGRNGKILLNPAGNTVYNGRDYKDVFNVEYYAKRYSDLKNVYGNDQEKLLKHFVLYGMKEGRQGSEEFNVRIYRANYGDLRNIYGDNLEKYYIHYIIAGKTEGRNGKTEKEFENLTVYNGRDYKDIFNAEYYYNRYGDLRNTYGKDAEKLLKHFVLYGMKEGRQGNEEFDVKVYRAKYGDLENAYDDDWERYYIHYIIAGKEEGRTGKF